MLGPTCATTLKTRTRGLRRRGLLTENVITRSSIDFLLGDADPDLVHVQDDRLCPDAVLDLVVFVRDSFVFLIFSRTSLPQPPATHHPFQRYGSQHVAAAVKFPPLLALDLVLRGLPVLAATTWKQEHNGLIPYIYFMQDEKQMDRNTTMQTVKSTISCTAAAAFTASPPTSYTSGSTGYESTMKQNEAVSCNLKAHQLALWRYTDAKLAERGTERESTAPLRRGPPSQDPAVGEPPHLLRQSEESTAVFTTPHTLCSTEVFQGELSLFEFPPAARRDACVRSKAKRARGPDFAAEAAAWRRTEGAGLSEELDPAQPRVIQGHTVQDIDENEANQIQSAREEEQRTLQLLVEQEQQSQQSEGQGTDGRSDTSVVIATLLGKVSPQTLALPSIL
ncbi:hypothetical protein ON010_g9014 [Phytophthora cinnamomi]|nr:hypothetical protein ON010_g9014 [Phytophthora cinnamomi]